MPEIKFSDYKAANLLPEPGYTRKTNHIGCSESQAMKIINDAGGYHLHCFKCAEHLFVPHESNTYQDRKRREAEIAAVRQEKERAGWDLPVDFSQIIAPAGLAWLGSGGWTDELICKYGFGWSDRLSRVVMPLDIGWQARAVHDGQHPKYLSKYPTDMIWRSEPIGKRVCLVEDILSAGRVGQVYPSVAILGTNPRNVMQWIGRCEEVVAWFDNDDAGRKARSEVDAVLRWIPSITFREVRSGKDPKKYTTREIMGLLERRAGVTWR